MNGADRVGTSAAHVGWLSAVARGVIRRAKEAEEAAAASGTALAPDKRSGKRARRSGGGGGGGGGSAGAVRVQGQALSRTVDGPDDVIGCTTGRGHGYVRARCCGADGAC